MTFREDIKGRTRNAHDRVDEAASKFDISTRLGLAQFLLGNLLGYRLCLGGATSIEKQLKTRIQHLEDDLRELGIVADPFAGALKMPKYKTQLGATYVICGSQMGNRVLNRLRIKSKDDRVLKACRFFTDTSLLQPWQDLITLFSDLKGSEIYLAEIVGDAVKCFESFEVAFEVASIFEDGLSVS